MKSIKNEQKAARELAKVLWLNDWLYILVKPPAMFMDRLRFSRKIGVMAGVWIAALATLSWFLIPMEWGNIAFTTREVEAVTMLDTDMKYLRDLIDERGLASRVLGGESNLAGDLAKARTNTESVGSQLDAWFQQNIKSKTLNDQWAALKKHRQALLASASKADADDIIYDYNDLLGEVLDLRQAVADADNLTLDPVIDTYALQDATVSQAANLIEQVGQATAMGFGIAQRHALTPGERKRLTSLNVMISFYASQIAADIQRVVPADPQYAEAMKQALAGFIEAQRPFSLALDTQILGTQGVTIDAEAYAKLGNTAIDRSTALHQALLTPLREQIDNRLHRYHLGSTRMMIVCVAIFLLGGYLFFGFSRSLSATLRGLARASHALAAGEFPERIDLRTQDELQAIADEMAKVTIILRDFDTEQNNVARRHEAGDTDARLDADRFCGAFRNMAIALNSAFDGHIQVQQRMTEVIGRYARGDLSVEMDRLPGNRAAISESFDQVRSLLKRINDEILGLSKAAADGEFSSRGNVDGLEFAFRDMVEGLNRLMENAERGLSGVGEVLSALSDGDLRVRMRGEYVGMFAALRDNANASVEQLAQLVQGIRGSAEAIGSASSEISAGNLDLSGRTESQSASIQETAASVDQLTNAVRQNTESARQARQLAMGASDIARTGGEVVGQVVTTMNSINESSARIGDIIGVIDGIAFQTNILALNAAVEAARAGEHGRGFAVVASEVRSLAQRSADAAREIKTLIAASTERVEDGSRLVAKAGSTMHEIVSSVQRVTDIIGEIASASEVQSAGIDKVNKAITQMDEATQQNAALVEQASASARSLEEQAAGMVDAARRFALDEESRGPAAQSLDAPRGGMPSVIRARR